MTAPSTRPPGGTRDFLPDEARRRRWVVDVVRRVYERYGFEPLDTPALENLETLAGKYGEEGNRLIFKILRRGERERSGEADLALRYDLTVPLARVVAQYQNELPALFKRYQIQPVWRADRPARGRFREFHQCDIDAVGSTSPVVEAEILGAVCDVMEALGFADFTVRLNHRRLLEAMLRHMAIPVEYQSTVLVVLDKRDKIGSDGVLDELAKRGLPGPCVTRTRDWLEAGCAGEWLPWLRGHVDLLESDGRTAFENLEQIVGLAGGTAAGKRLRLDLTLARGLSYYTGAIMEIAAADLAGSLGGGGRYDNLVGMFLGRDVPACGFSLGLERILVVMSERGMFPAPVGGGAVDVMATLWSDETRADVLALAGELRRAGLRVDVYPEADRLGKQVKYAASRGVPVVTIVGDEERARGEVAVKDLRRGAQQSVPRAGLAAAIRRILESRSQGSEP